MSSSKDLIKALEEAGHPCTTTMVSEETLKKWAEINKEVESFFERVQEDKRRSDEYLKRYPMRFKGLFRPAVESIRMIHATAA